MRYSGLVSITSTYPEVLFMNESSLAATIDKLAKRKAEDFISQVKTVVEQSLKDAWRAKVAGGSEWLGADIKAVLIAYAQSIGIGDYKAPAPSEELVNLCRATVLNDILSGLPKLRELAMMQADESPE
jgi:hypothetical protein